MSHDEKTGKKPGKKHKRRWRGLLTWLSGLAAGVIVAVIAPFAVQGITAAVDQLTTASGPPVLIHVDPTSRDLWDDVSIPSNATLTAADQKFLARTDPEEADRWMVVHKHGVEAGTKSLFLVLTGNRTGTIRVTDVTTHAVCHTPDRGTLVRMDTGRGGGAPTLAMEIDVQERNPQPYTFGSNGQRPFFPATTITLARGEQQAVLVDLNPDYKKIQVCNVQLNLRILDGDKETNELVPTTVTTMGDEPTSEDSAYRHAYLGSGICAAFVVPTPRWEDDVPTACGKAGLSPYAE